MLRKYTPVKGDPIDELLAKALNATKFSEIPITRLGKGKYRFGEKEFRAKIVNNKLIIQVGGGYMSADEYINQYGQTELDKLIYRDVKKLESQIKKGMSRALVKTDTKRSIKTTREYMLGET